MKTHKLGTDTALVGILVFIGLVFSPALAWALVPAGANLYTASYPTDYACSNPSDSIYTFDQTNAPRNFEPCGSPDFSGFTFQDWIDSGAGAGSNYGDVYHVVEVTSGDSSCGSGDYNSCIASGVFVGTQSFWVVQTLGAVGGGLFPISDAGDMLIAQTNVIGSGIVAFLVIVVGAWAGFVLLKWGAFKIAGLFFPGLESRNPWWFPL